MKVLHCQFQSKLLDSKFDKVRSDKYFSINDRILFWQDVSDLRQKSLQSILACDRSGPKQSQSWLALDLTDRCIFMHACADISEG